MKPTEIIQAATSALLALSAVLGAFGIAFYELANRQEVKLPDFVGILIGGVVGSYLTHVASSNGARQAGTAAAQSAIDRAAATAQGVLDAASAKPTSQ